MTITITSGGIAALCAVLALSAGFALWAVQAIVANELRKWNGRYVFANGTALTGHEIETRIEALEAWCRGCRDRDRD